MSKIIAVDFDGTCVRHRYPAIGETIPNCLEVLKELMKAKHRIMLWTIRSGETLDEAIDWFSEKGIMLWGVNENPGQHKWSQSYKQHAHIYIDDAALGCPTSPDPEQESRKMVDWLTVRTLLVNEGIIKSQFVSEIIKVKFVSRE